MGTGQGYSVLEIIKNFEKVSNCKITYTITNRRRGDIATYFADASIAESLIKWKAKLSINRMCEDLWRWQNLGNKAI